jgi:hypothetical protein
MDDESSYIKEGGPEYEPPRERSVFDVDPAFELAIQMTNLRISNATSLSARLRAAPDPPPPIPIVRRVCYKCGERHGPNYTPPGHKAGDPRCGV